MRRIILTAALLAAALIVPATAQAIVFLDAFAGPHDSAGPATRRGWYMYIDDANGQFDVQGLRRVHVQSPLTPQFSATALQDLAVSPFVGRVGTVFVGADRLPAQHFLYLPLLSGACPTGALTTDGQHSITVPLHVDPTALRQIFPTTPTCLPALLEGSVSNNDIVVTVDLHAASNAVGIVPGSRGFDEVDVKLLPLAAGFDIAQGLLADNPVSAVDVRSTATVVTCAASPCSADGTTWTDTVRQDLGGATGVVVHAPRTAVYGTTISLTGNVIRSLSGAANERLDTYLHNAAGSTLWASGSFTDGAGAFKITGKARRSGVLNVLTLGPDIPANPHVNTLENPAAWKTVVVAPKPAILQYRLAVLAGGRHRVQIFVRAKNGSGLKVALRVGTRVFHGKLNARGRYALTVTARKGAAVKATLSAVGVRATARSTTLI